MECCGAREPHFFLFFFSHPDNKLAVVRSFSLQIVFASKTWETAPAHVKPLKEQFLSVLLKSWADSTAKRYVGDIRAFLKWCRLNNIEVGIPVSAATAAIYMFQLMQKQTSAVTLVRIQAALKWFHSFTPSGGPNPLDDSLYVPTLSRRPKEIDTVLLSKRLRLLRILSKA